MSLLFQCRTFGKTNTDSKPKPIDAIFFFGGEASNMFILGVLLPCSLQLLLDNATMPGLSGLCLDLEVNNHKNCSEY